MSLGLFEPALGALMARRAVQTLVQELVAAGGEYALAAVAAPGDGERLDGIAVGSRTLRAGRYVFACGPWLPKMFPSLLGARIFPTRQEVFFFAPPAGDLRFSAGQLPGWADFNDGDHEGVVYFEVPSYHGTGAYKKTIRKHQVSVEPLLAEAKEWHGLRRLRLCGLLNANIQGLLIAAGAEP